MQMCRFGNSTLRAYLGFLTRRASVSGSANTADDARVEDNKALREAAANRHTEVLRALRNDFGLNIEYMYVDDSSTGVFPSVEDRHVDTLRSLWEDFGLSAKVGALATLPL